LALLSTQLVHALSSPNQVYTARPISKSYDFTSAADSIMATTLTIIQDTKLSFFLSRMQERHSPNAPVPKTTAIMRRKIKRNVQLICFTPIALSSALMFKDCIDCPSKKNRLLCF